MERPDDDMREVYVFLDEVDEQRQIRTHHTVDRRRRQRVGIFVLSGWILACLTVLILGVLLPSFDVILFSVFALVVLTPLLSSILGRYEVFGKIGG